MSTVTYRLAPDAWKATRKKTIIASVLISLCIYAIVIVNGLQKNPELDWETAYIALGLMTVITPIQIFRLLKKKKASMDNFSLTLDDTGLTAVSQNGEVTLTYLEIRDITRSPDGGLLISSNYNSDIITIPPLVERKEELETRLNEIYPFAPAGKNIHLSFYSVSFIICYIIVLFAFLSSTNRVINIVTGPLAIAGVAWVLGRVNRTDAAPALKRVRWTLIILIAAFAYKWIVYTFQLNWLPFDLKN